MSSTLKWRPLIFKDSLSDELKYILQKKYGYPIKTTLDISDLNYLEGLKHCNVKDVDKLISIIKQFKEIELMETY